MTAVPQEGDYQFRREASLKEARDEEFAAFSIWSVANRRS
jgi:hypothetical protein